MIAAANDPLSLTGVDGLFLLAAAVAVFGSASAALAICGGHTIADLWRGKDGRASTSKLQPVLWTLGVAWALTAMLIAELATNNVHSALSSGWDALMDNDLQEEYLLLLGIPIGTAVVAKGITTHNVTSGKVVSARVQLGIRTANSVQLASGVQPGDSVIVTGLLALRDGADVKPLLDQATARAVAADSSAR